MSPSTYRPAFRWLVELLNCGPERRFGSTRSRVALSGLAVVILVIGGCDGFGSSSPPKRSGFSMSGMDSAQSTVVGKQSDHLARVINLVKNDDVAEWDVFESSITTSLNTAWNVAKSGEGWSSMQAAFPEWERSKLLDTLPSVYQDSLWWREFASETFLYTDSHYIQEQFWLSRIAARVVNEPTGTRFAYLTHAGRPQPVSLVDALQRADPQLSGTAALRLQAALKLFDWSVRNVTGEPFPPVLDGDAAAEVALGTIDPARPLSYAGVRGAGYRNYLWQTLNYGRGDTWEQAHVFLQLARHAGLDACVIGVPGRAPTPQLPRVSHPDVLPWAIGVLIEDQIYLWDPRLGLPLHHPETLAILTLPQVRANPAFLAWQGLRPEESTEADSVYPVRSSELENLVALLDYPLDGFSLRCHFLQRNLTGGDRVDVYFAPDEVAARFAARPEISDVQLWALPLEIQIFREAVREATLRSARDRFVQAKLQWRSREEAYFDGFPLLRKSRVLYLLGRFQPDPSGLTEDCLQEFQKMRYSDEDWRNIADNPDLQKTLGLYRASGQSVSEFQQAMEGQKVAMMIVRADAQMYLAIAHAEMQNHNTSLNWLKLVPGFDQEGKWKRHTGYLQGRSHEAMKNYAAAVQSYQQLSREFRSHRSPREYGNLLRARILQRPTQVSAAEPSPAE